MSIRPCLAPFIIVMINTCSHSSHKAKSYHYLTARCRSVIIRHESRERSLPMEKYIPYEKLSKKEQRKRDAKGRTTWGALNPVTRKPENSKAYDRQKARKWSDDSASVPLLISWIWLGCLSSSPLRSPSSSAQSAPSASPHTPPLCGRIRFSRASCRRARRASSGLRTGGRLAR